MPTRARRLVSLTRALISHSCDPTARTTSDRRLHANPSITARPCAARRHAAHCQPIAYARPGITWINEEKAFADGYPISNASISMLYANGSPPRNMHLAQQLCDVLAVPGRERDLY